MSWEEMESSTGLTPAVPLRHLKTPPMIEAAKKAMREQGCVIVEDGEYCIVTFPEGTMRREVFPRLYNVMRTQVQAREIMESESKYEIILYWSNEDEAFIAEVPELPGCAADGATYQEALANAEVVIQEWIDTARELGRPVPEPRGRLMYA